MLPHALLVSGVSTEEFVSQIFSEEMIKKAHPDFILVKPIKKEIQISQIRDCIRRLSLKPCLVPFKVAIIEKAHTLNQEAQSALLKTLEEPKGKALLILITDYPTVLLPTILSRVQRIKFHQLGKVRGPRAEALREIDQLSKSSLTSRFQYAEKIYKSPELREILTAWLHYFRRDLIKNKALLQKIQTVHYLLSRTNINPRLALETLMLEL